MGKTKKIRVAVLYGGRSGEHEVSIASATNVIQNLDRSQFEVVPIGIDKHGGWFLGDDSSVLQLQREEERKLFAPTLIGKAAHERESEFSPTPSISPEFNHLASTGKNGQIGFLTDRIFDVVFPVIHGPLCEDGTVQGLLELADVPYVGCGVLASAIGMDKDVSKRLAEAAGIPIAPYLTIKQGAFEKDPARFLMLVEQKLRYPVFVKPSNAGSSVGVSKVKHPADLMAALQAAFKYDTKIVVEQGINALEIEVAVLESLEYGNDPIISVPGEVRPTANHEFYSYASKYLDEKGAELFIPAPLSEELQAKVRQVAKDIFLALECEGMARVDLFVERETNQIYFNEINSIPGFTKISMYPKLMNASGMSYPELLSHLIHLATERHARKSRLSCEYIPA
ncbi:MAG: D-alanine--D-alanine ligase [Gammaproteobacteria bacterium]|nr:D-alanine--D-alanine ligase [Gammaproteobacteria bacterium]